MGFLKIAQILVDATGKTLLAVLAFAVTAKMGIANVLFGCRCSLLGEI
ncbi:hypothetical protein [Nostoc sp. TCL26-01]|nr:hypothetical protein [Nostoc sp. TCL26-01]